MLTRQVLFLQKLISRARGKAICDLAHARGAMVYADIIQAAGAVPIDVHALDVDFCACATYKWLMGDFGAGFLYVRKACLPELKRSQFGYRQFTDMKSHVFPFDPVETAHLNLARAIKRETFLRWVP